MTIVSFPPIEAADAHSLILGSMPGADSLRDNQYYAHKQNAFWFIMNELFGAGFDVDYSERMNILKNNHIALWDVLKQCKREGSLDSNIRDEQPNDIGLFVARHNQLKRILFNGKKSEQMFKKYIAPEARESIAHIELIALPSTSPAMATLNKQQKMEMWKKGLCL